MTNERTNPPTTAVALAALLCTALVAAPVQAASIAGRAFGAQVDTLLGPDLAPTPLAVLDPAVGLNTAEAASIDLPSLLRTGALDSATSGAVGENAATSQARSTASAVDVLGGLVRADLVMAMASSAANGVTAASRAEGSTLVGLLVAGAPVGATVPPNTRIELPGVGYVVVFEQVPSGDGVNSSGLTVNMLRVVTTNLFGIKTGEIVVGSARSQASFLPADASPPR